MSVRGPRPFGLRVPGLAKCGPAKMAGIVLYARGFLFMCPRGLGKALPPGISFSLGIYGKGRSSAPAAASLDLELGDV